MSTDTDTTSVTREIPGIGTLEFEQTPTRRNYWLRAEGNTRRTRLPSVTSILRDTWPKPALLEWYAKNGANSPALLKAASERGTNVHRFVEVFMTTGELLPFAEFPDEHRGYLQGIARFLWEADPKPIAVERLVCHPELNYAGRLDLIAEIYGVPTLLDFKTNPRGAVYPEAHVQTTAYAIADERCGSPRVERIMIVGVAEDGTFNPVAGGDGAKVWTSALDLYRQMARFKKSLGGS
jgi:hypothetical protein